VPTERRGSQPRLRLHCGCTVDSNGRPNPGGCPIGQRGLRRAGGSSPRGDLAIQVPATPTGEVRRYVKSVSILAGLRHRHYGSRWRHHRNGNILPCCLVRADPDLAREPHPRIDLLLVRALHAVHSELRQRFSAPWRGGSPPCSEAGTRGNSSGTKVRGTIPRIFDASIITAFRQGVRDEKMLEKLATHDVETVTTLFALADKCARATEGRAWHSAPQTGVTHTGGSGAVAQDGKKKKKKNCGHERPPSAAPVIAAVTRGRSKRNKHPRPQRGNSDSCPVHPNSRHNAAECREIIELTKRVSERREQMSKDGSPPRRRPGKERVDDGEVAAGERDLGYQSPKGVLKDVFTGDSDSGDDS
jgi:hypothetical protein